MVRIGEHSFKRLVTLDNYQGTGAKKPGPRRRIAELRDMFYNNHVNIPTSRSYQQDIDRIQNTLQEGDLFAVKGGDGTVQKAITALVMAGKPIPLLTLEGGDIDDFAHMLHGSLGKAHIHQVIEKSRKVGILPIKTLIESDPGTEPRQVLSASYVSTGCLSAKIAHQFNSKEYRQRFGYNNSGVRFIQKAATILNLARTAGSQTPISIKDEAGKRDVYDILFCNGDRMARLGQPPGELTDPNIYTNEIQDPRPLAIASWITRFTTGTLPRDYIEAGQSRTIELQSDNVPIQFDGETEHLPLGTTLTIASHDVPFYALQSI